MEPRGTRLTGMDLGGGGWQLFQETMRIQKGQKNQKALNQSPIPKYNGLKQSTNQLLEARPAHCGADSVTLCKGKVPRRKNVITHFPQSNEALKHFLKIPKTQVSPSYAGEKTASHLNQAREAGDTAGSLCFMPRI